MENEKKTTASPGRQPGVKMWVAIGAAVVVLGVLLWVLLGNRINSLTQSGRTPVGASGTQSYLEQGNQSLAVRDYDQAVTSFTKAIEQGNDLAKAYAGRGDGYYGLIRYKEAAQDYTSSLGYQRSAEVLTDRCHTYRMLNELALARSDCDAALAIDPQSADAHIALSLLYQDQKDSAQARSEIDKALSADPKSVDAYHALSQIETESGNLEKAIEVLSKCVELDPTNPIWYWERGYLYYSLAKFDLAKSDFQSVLQYGKPNSDGTIMFQAGSILRSLGQNSQQAYP